MLQEAEVETAMSALVAPGAPVSVLLEYGLAEDLIGKLVESGIGTIEKLGGMTPEQLEEIQGIDPTMVERIQESVNAYYSQFEQPLAEEAPAAAAAEAAPPEAEAPKLADAPEPEPQAEPPEPAGAAAESATESIAAEETTAEAQSDTIEASGSQTDQPQDEGERRE